MKKIGFIILSLVIVLIVTLIEVYKTTPIDWRKTYYENNKKPFDLKVFYEQLPHVYTDKKVRTIKKTFYEHVQANKSINRTQNNLYINIDHQYLPGASSEKKLLKFIGNGNMALISANHFSESLLNSLLLNKYVKIESLKDSITLKIKKGKYKYLPKLKFNQTYFKDTIHFKSLGTVSFKHKDSLIHKTNYIQIPYKKGLFFLHTQPEIFTNYHLLKVAQPNYVNQLLSLIPDKIFKDQKPSKIYFESNFKTDADLINSPLRFIKKQKGLSLAWNIALIGVALFLIFNAKRKQRIIPIIPKVRNTSLDFVETISGLYEDSENFQAIIQQKINVFHKNIRNQYHITTNATNQQLVKQLSLKSGYDIDKTTALIRLINTLKNRETSSINLLLKLNKEIEAFYKTTSIWKKN